mgnify:CR=1 FL=1
MIERIVRDWLAEKLAVPVCMEVPANAASVYTTNLVKGAPLTVTKQHLADGKAQAIICNSGNANTCKSANAPNSTNV